MLCAILFRLLAFAIANAFDTKNGLETTLPSRLALFSLFPLALRFFLTVTFRLILGEFP